MKELTEAVITITLKEDGADITTSMKPDMTFGELESGDVVAEVLATMLKAAKNRFG